MLFSVRFDPKKPTEYPRDQQVTHPDQPHHIYFSLDEQRREFYSKHPSHPVYLSYSPDSVSVCEKWMKGELDVLADSQVRLPLFDDVDIEKTIGEEFDEIRNNCDISDIDLTNP